MSKFRKALRKFARGEFRELSARFREELTRRRERRHCIAGEQLFAPPHFDRIFSAFFLDRYGSAGPALDLARALLDKDPQKFFPGFSRLDRFREALSSGQTDQRDRIIISADLILKDEFPVFHRPFVSYGSPPAWNLDPDSRRAASDQFYGDSYYLDGEAVGDSKVIWELSRFQFVYDLGQAYVLTSDERYPDKLFRLLHDWNQANPDYRGINFCSALEFAFRAHSVAWAIFFFRESPKLTAAAHDLYRLLYISGRFLRDHLSIYFSPNTHLLGEAYGLYLLGTLFPEFSDSNDWRQCGRRILLEEIERQFTIEGMHAERSTCYHAYAVEFVLSFLLLAERNNDNLPSSVSARFEQMTNVLAALQRPDGHWPDIGDNDGGRLYFLSRSRPLDYSSLLAAARRYLGIQSTQAKPSLEAFWLSSGSSASSVVESRPAEPGPALLLDAGLAISRSGENYSIFQFGPFGYRDSPHSHADQLHLEICVGEDALLVDPGTFSYTGNRAGRNQFRACLAHNGPRIFGVEYFDPDDLFAWRQQPFCRLKSHFRNRGSEYYEAGYTIPVDSEHHADLRRSILFIGDGCWLVRDSVRCTKPIQAAWDFRAQESIQWHDKTAIINGRQSSLRIVPVGLYSCDVEVINSWIPLDYGRGNWGGALRVITHFNREIDMAWTIQTAPATKRKSTTKDPIALYERTETSAPDNESASFALFKFAEAPGERVQSDAEIAYVSLGPLESIHAALVKASRLVIDNTTIFQSDRVLEYVDLAFDGAVWTIFADATDGITIPDPSTCRLNLAERAV